MGRGTTGAAGEPASVALRTWVAAHAVDVPLPGRGRTWERFGTLAEVAGEDLALGRLVEGHLDALAILAEAGAAAEEGAVLGVWAARDATDHLRATRGPDGWRVDGRKPFCSGAHTLDVALVTAEADDGPRLFAVEVGATGLSVEPGTWPAVGMADSDSPAVVFGAVPVTPVGPPGFYTGRPGFWWGAIGVAACWWGGIRALLTAVADHLAAVEPDATDLAGFGAVAARCESAGHTLRWAAGEIDGTARLADPIATLRRTARLTRETVHAAGTAALAGAAAAGGARPLCLDAAQSRRSADLYAYLSQHHAGRDAAALARDLLELRLPTA